MSTILKALRRLEEEKTRGGTPRPLREEVASGPSEAPRGRRLPWLPIAAGLLGVGLGASAWYVWPYERGGEPVRDDVAAAALAPASATAPSGVTAPAAGFATAQPELPASAPAIAAHASEPTIAELQQEDGPSEDAFASQVEVVQRPAAEPRIQPVAPRPQPAPAAPGAKPAAVASAPRVAEPAPEPLHGLPEPAGVIARHAEIKPLRPGAPQPAAAKPKSAAPPPPDGSDWKEPAEPEPAPAPVASATAPAATPAPPAPPAPGPAAASASASAPSAAPELHVRRTQWHPDKGRRSAEVELAGKSESVREGDVVGEYVVTEIRPSGVVLTRDGQKIERKIGK